MKILVVSILLYLSSLADTGVSASPVGLDGHDATRSAWTYLEPQHGPPALGRSVARFAPSFPGGGTVAGTSSAPPQSEPWTFPQASASTAGTRELFSAPSRELDQEDFDFLDSIAHDLDSVGQDHTSETRVQSPDSPYPVEPSVFWKPLAHWNEHPPAIADSSLIDPKVLKNAGLREYIGWPGPRLLPQLGLWRPLREHGIHGDLTFEESAVPRDRINAALFANKLQWVDIDQFWKKIPTRWQNKMPVRRLSQRLPFVYTRPSDGTQLRLYMIESNLQTQTGSILRGSPLERAPLFTFWGVPQRATGRVEMSLLGVGCLLPADNEAVDERLRAVLEAAQHASHIPL